jgi:DNA-binding response OmpR family regulator
MAVGETIWIISHDPVLVEQVQLIMPLKELKTFCKDIGDDFALQIKEISPAMVILDKTLKGTNAFLICREIRAQFDGPILFLDEIKDDMDELLAFETGADDYIARPFHPPILAARINALLKRAKSHPKRPLMDTVAIGDLVVDSFKREAYLNGGPLRLTTIQFDLLWHLVTHMGTVVSRDELSQVLYHSEYNGIDRSIDIYISRIRQKLGDDASEPVYLKTVRGVGYLFTGPGDARR